MQTAQATKLTDLRTADQAPEAGTVLEDRTSGVVIQLDEFGGMRLLAVSPATFLAMTELRAC